MVMNIKIVPGINNSGPEHWQSFWEKKYGYERINQEEWSQPKYNDWESNLIKSLESNGGKDTILVAHSLGCLLIAKAMPRIQKYLRAIFLVAPPDPKGKIFPGFLDSFIELPSTNLAVPGFLVYSENDEYNSSEFCTKKANEWGLKAISVGERGHINVESNLGEWDEGYDLFQRLLFNIDLANDMAI
jgi:predicted alpha/beta hydrolase family esterase